MRGSVVARELREVATRKKVPEDQGGAGEPRGEQLRHRSCGAGARDAAVLEGRWRLELEGGVVSLNQGRRRQK